MTKSEIEAVEDVLKFYFFGRRIRQTDYYDIVQEIRKIGENENEMRGMQVLQQAAERL